jgi:hypothetical protein
VPSRIAGRASAEALSGTDTRTRAAPAAARAWICCLVASTSVVGVFVMDWTETGAPPPMGRLPAVTCSRLAMSAPQPGGHHPGSAAEVVAH